MCFFLCEVRALFFNFQTLDLFPFGGGGVARDLDRAYYAITLVLLCVCSFVCVCVCVCVWGGRGLAAEPLLNLTPCPITDSCGPMAGKSRSHLQIVDRRSHTF